MSTVKDNPLYSYAIFSTVAINGRITRKNIFSSTGVHTCRAICHMVVIHRFPFTTDFHLWYRISVLVILYLILYYIEYYQYTVLLCTIRPPLYLLPQYRQNGMRKRLRNGLASLI